MSFEEIDKKIKEAADNHHPAYNENAWDKMEGLLNKHMPEKKERRRAALWLLLLLITAGGAGYFLINQTTNNKTGIVTTTASQKNESPVNIQHEKPGTNNSLQNESSNTENPVINPLTPSINHPVQNNTLAIITHSKTNKEKNLFVNPTHPNRPGLSTTADQTLTIDPSPSINTSDDKISSAPVSKDRAEIKTAETEKQLTGQAKQANDRTEVQPHAQAKRSKAKKGNGLFFSLSAGPDVSAIELANAGRVKLSAGIGVGYKFGNRFSIQTGFYTSRKIYTAQPYQYNAPSWWWTYYPRLESVDANCKVYEIPLLASYNFARTKKANWFATTGLSSYLMKKEEYTYNFKTGTGQSASRDWVYNNENKHFFSVLTLAGGYERNLNKQLSLSVSPYFKIPLAGVGFGKVKLNSAGLMVNANFKPFIKK